jgi:hypothetical protein
MDMKAFPFDRQVLHLCLASDEPICEMEYTKHPTAKTNSMLFENLAEWRLDNPNGDTHLEPSIYHDVLGDHVFGFQRCVGNTGAYPVFGFQLCVANTRCLCLCEKTSFSHSAKPIRNLANDG